MAVWLPGLADCIHGGRSIWSRRNVPSRSVATSLYFVLLGGNRFIRQAEEPPNNTVDLIRAPLYRLAPSRTPRLKSDAIRHQSGAAFDLIPSIHHSFILTRKADDSK